MEVRSQTEALAPFREQTLNPYRSVSETRKRTGMKVIGVFPMWLPEELVHAAGMLPVVMWRSDEPVTWGHGYIPAYNCPINRSVVDDAVKGKLKFMDGMIFLRQCLQSQEVAYVIEHNALPAFEAYLYMPPIHHDDEIARGWVRDELNKLKAGLEIFSGGAITSQKLNQSIRVYNHNRSLLRRLYELRKARSGIISAADTLRVVWSSMLMPKEEHSARLETLLEQLEGTPAPKAGKPKVFLSGSLCIHPQFEILDMIEEMGMVVVDDDLYTGYRYFANDAAVGSDPIGALVDRHFVKTPLDPAKGEMDVHWGDELVAKARADGAGGVITLITKYCPPHLCYYPDVKARLAAAGIPEIMLEIEHEVISLQGIKTRLQSFAETLRGV